jgi:hypothetical protein
MSATDIIWTTLGVLMVVCVYIDSGMTFFSAIQMFGLGEALIVIAFPFWSIWSSIYLLNLPLEIACVFCTRRYLAARTMMAFHAALKLMVLFSIDDHFGLREDWIFWMTHYLNQGILLMLLASSARSFFTTRSTYARNKPGRTHRSTHNPSPKAHHQLAFVRGLY